MTICICFVTNTTSSFADAVVNTTTSTTLPPLAPSIQTTESQTASANSQFASDLSALEDKFYSHDFSNEPIEQRLDRVERLVYGAKKEGTVDQRVTQLLLNVPNLASASRQPSVSNTQNEVAPDEDSMNHPAIQGPPPDHSLSAEVTLLENKVLGKTYRSDTLINRVARLESAVFPGQTNQTFAPLNVRINRLLTATQPYFSAPPKYSSSTPIVASYQHSNDEKEKEKKGHPLLHKLGKMIGKAGIFAGEAVGSMAMNSMMMGGYGYGGGYGGYGYPGYGYGYPGMGYPGSFIP